MDKNQYSYNGKTLQRVSKTTAKKLFNDGQQIYLMASNLRIDNFWISPCPLCLSSLPAGYNHVEDKFEYFCSEFMYYNCSSETGKYIHFYREVK